MSLVEAEAAAFLELVAGLALVLAFLELVAGLALVLAFVAVLAKVLALGLATGEVRVQAKED